MAEENDQEKTEPASPQRLEKAREEGQVVQSRELATFVVLMTGGTGLWMMAGGLGQAMSGIVRDGMQFDPGMAHATARTSWRSCRSSFSRPRWHCCPFWG